MVNSRQRFRAALRAFVDHGLTVRTMVRLRSYLSGFEEAMACRYSSLSLVGSGSTSVVYAAYDSQLQRRVALKVLRPELSWDTAAERFLRGVRTAARLRHPNILPVFDCGLAAGLL